MKASARLPGLVSLVLTAAACSTASLPNIGALADPDALARTFQQALPIGPEKEREIGFGIAATVAGRYGLVDDPGLTRYIGLVGQAVAQQSPRLDEVEFHFGVLDTDDVNAFASPGGFVLVTRGALALMETEAELAAVLAHEVSHIDQKHVLDQIRRSSVLEQAREETEIEGPLLDRIAEFGTSLLFTGLSREDELEADSLGLIYAVATGYEARGLGDFLGRLGAVEQTGGGGLREWVATHPPTSDRIEAITRQTAGLTQAGGASGRERFQRSVVSTTGGTEPPDPGA